MKGVRSDLNLHQVTKFLHDDLMEWQKFQNGTLTWHKIFYLITGGRMQILTLTRGIQCLYKQMKLIFWRIMIIMLIVYYCSIFDKYWDDSHIDDVSWYGGMRIMMNMCFVMIILLYAHDGYDMHNVA